MKAQLVVLTGASGAGKTTIALAVERDHPELTVFQFDTIGVPSPEIMASYGSGHQPGGAWQRAVTFQWLERIAPVLAAGRSVLFEGQMRIAFIQEALAFHNIADARIILIECDNETLTTRLSTDRLQPELANESMLGWSRYLHEEALEAGCVILNTTAKPLDDSVYQVLANFS